MSDYKLKQAANIILDIGHIRRILEKLNEGGEINRSEAHLYDYDRLVYTLNKIGFYYIEESIFTDSAIVSYLEDK